VSVPTVLMCVRDNAATLDRQLGALAAQDIAEPWRLVVVDNGSTDTSRAIIDRWAIRMPQLEVFDEPRAGANWARNRGLREVDGGVVACCDADDEVSTSWLRELVKALDDHDVVGGALDPYRINPAHAARDACPQQTGLPSLFGRSWIVGANMGFHARVAAEIGGFDPAFSAGSDEIDFCIRAQCAGFSIGFAPDAIVAYHLRATAGALLRQRFRYGRGHERLVRKHAHLEHGQRTQLQRWKVVAAQSREQLARVPNVSVRRERLDYFASAGFAAGRVAELLQEATRPRPRTSA
jgi:glycosyltransferase involved in cell wall biosynthesis